MRLVYPTRLCCNTNCSTRQLWRWSRDVLCDTLSSCLQKCYSLRDEQVYRTVGAGELFTKVIIVIWLQVNFRQSSLETLEHRSIWIQTARSMALCGMMQQHRVVVLVLLSSQPKGLAYLS